MKKTNREITPHEDYGFFGPDSVTHKVWGYPTTPLMGIVRAVTIEELDPNLLAAVHNTGANYDRLNTRYARTVQYFAAVAFADSRSVSKMADVLVKIHSKAIGIEPVSGNRYDANDPDSQLWILITGWHSVLTAYETFGPGKLSDAEVDRFWAECAIAAEFQTCDPAAVPRTREEVRAYFEGWRPTLAASEATQRMMHHLLNGAGEIMPRKGLLGLTRPIANWLICKGTIATLPASATGTSSPRRHISSCVLVSTRASSTTTRRPAMRGSSSRRPCSERSADRRKHRPPMVALLLDAVCLRCLHEHRGGSEQCRLQRRAPITTAI